MARGGWRCFPRLVSTLAVGSGRTLAILGLVLGSGAWLSGFLTEALWPPLARYTFTVVEALLGLAYPNVVSNPSKLILGTPAFKVAIAPECSGYEGIGLLMAFLGIYFWLFRRELRFPGALLLLPLGAVTIWMVNAAAHRGADRHRDLRLAGHRAWRIPLAGGLARVQCRRAGVCRASESRPLLHERGARACCRAN